MSPGPSSTRASNILEIGRDDALAAACHKLRTPLTAAMGFIQLALRDARRTRTEAPHLEMVDEQLRRMASLIDELSGKGRE